MWCVLVTKFLNIYKVHFDSRDKTYKNESFDSMLTSRDIRQTYFFLSFLQSQIQFQYLKQLLETISSSKKQNYAMKRSEKLCFNPKPVKRKRNIIIYLQHLIRFLPIKKDLLHRSLFNRVEMPILVIYWLLIHA